MRGSHVRSNLPGRGHDLQRGAKKRSRLPLGRIGRRLALLILVAAFVVYILLPAGFGVYAVLPAKENVGAPPVGFEAVTLTTADGVQLAGWYAPPGNGAAIILLHGAGSSRQALRPYAGMLARHGYGVLAVDLRGHGESGGQTNLYGWQGSRDVQAAVSFLQAQAAVERIGALGLSLGGEILLGAASDAPQLKAIIADGATVRSIDDLLAMPSERPLVRNFVSRVQFLTVQLLSGEQPPLRIVDSLSASHNHFLLVAGGAEPREIAFGELYVDAAGERAQLWIAPGAAHVGAFNLDRDEYERRVIGFFGEWLLRGD